MKLKTIISTLFAGTALLTTVPACTDLTETVYDQTVTANYYQTHDDVIRAYLRPFEHGFWSITSTYRLQELTADQIGTWERDGWWYDGGQWERLHDHTWGLEGGEADIITGCWNGFFQGIGQCNSVVEDFARLHPEQFGFTEEEFADSEEMSQILESMSIYWGEDLPYSLSYVCKTLDAMGKGIRWSMPPLYLSETRKGEDVEDDRLFARNLLRASYVNFGKYAGMVSESASNWDNDRMVSTDMCLIVMGMAEAVAFPTIPVKVTINEYVEISKYFGTPKSKIFVNGILDKVIQRLASEGKVVKSGKGLI